MTSRLIGSAISSPLTRSFSTWLVIASNSRLPPLDLAGRAGYRRRDLGGQLLQPGLRGVQRILLVGQVGFQRGGHQEAVAVLGDQRSGGGR